MGAAEESGRRVALLRSLHEAAEVFPEQRIEVSVAAPLLRFAPACLNVQPLDAAPQADFRELRDGFGVVGESAALTGRPHCEENGPC